MSNIRAFILIYKRAILAVLPVCVVFAVLTVQRNREWENNTALYTADVQKAPDNSRLHYYLGTDMLFNGTDGNLQYGLIQEGITQLKATLKIFPAFKHANSQTGDAYMQLKQYDSALIYLQRAQAMAPADTTAMRNLSAVYFFLAKYPLSIAECRKLISIYACDARSYRNIGSCYLKMGSYDSAIQALNTAVQLAPSGGAAYRYLAYAWKQKGNTDSVLKYERLAEANIR